MVVFHSNENSLCRDPQRIYKKLCNNGSARCRIVFSRLAHALNWNLTSHRFNTIRLIYSILIFIVNNLKRCSENRVFSKTIFVKNNLYHSVKHPVPRSVFPVDECIGYVTFLSTLLRTNSLCVEIKD